MTRYKGRRVSRSIGILAASKKGRFLIHDYTHWRPCSPFAHEKSFDWIISKGFITPYSVFVGPGFSRAGLLEQPLSDANELHSALTILNKNSSAKSAGISASIPASRPTDLHEYWIEKNTNPLGKTVYSVFYNLADTTPFEILSEDEFHFDYVITRPITSATV